VTEKITPNGLLAFAAAANTSSTAAAPSLESSFHKKTTGVYLWKTSSMALLSKGRTFGTELVSMNDFKESASKVAKSFLKSSNGLNKTTEFSATFSPLADAVAPKVTSSFYSATEAKIL